MNENVLWDSMKEETNITTTENGDKAYKSTLNPLIDFMFKAATLRESEESEISKLFISAYNENKVYATRLAFYIRDIRGGQGERRVFRICMNTLINIDPETFLKIMTFIPEYGRWDDLICLMPNIKNSVIKLKIVNFIKDQLTEDLDNFKNKKSISLLAKWMPSENASSNETISNAKYLRKELALTPREYRKTLSILRDYLNILETKMSAKEWTEINYNHVPSKAMMKYRNAFKRNDTVRFTEYINALADPTNKTVKVNASTLYPFDIIKKCESAYGYDPNELSTEDINLLDAQWKALPDYFKDKFDNALVVADTSGSMEGTPLNVAIGLAIYLAERNKGIFNNKFITFSADPELQEIVGNNIYEKTKNLSKAHWSMNTDINAVFKLIYSNAIKNRLEQKDLPSAIYIISDMQFDCCEGGEDETVFEFWQNKFANSNYKLPTVIFWNVSDYGNSNVPITVKNTGAIVCSGYSPSIVKYIMESDVTNTMLLVEQIVNGERYNAILS